MHHRIFLGLILGGAAGVVTHLLQVRLPEETVFLQRLLEYVVEPVGQVFLRLLLMIVVPLVFATLTLGVARLGDLRRLGRIGLTTFAYFFLITAAAVTLGIFLAELLQPGGRMDPETRDRLSALHREGLEDGPGVVPEFGVDTFVSIVPRNPIEAAARGDMLAVIFFSLMTGVGLTILPNRSAEPLLQVLDSVGRVMVVLIDLIMKIAPYGVFALIFSVTARFGWDLLQQLLFYVGVVLGGLLIFQFGVNSLLVRFLGGLSPREFFSRTWTVMITAFSTSSSSATLPTTLRIAEENLKIPREISGFLLPLGATMHMNGTALFKGVTAVFLAQVWGVELNLGGHALIVVIAVLSAIGAAGVPGGSIPLLILLLQTVGIPPHGVALVLGVDRILDMSRTAVNVTGDLCAACFVARMEELSAASGSARSEEPRRQPSSR